MEWLDSGSHINGKYMTSTKLKKMKPLKILRQKMSRDLVDTG